ARSPGGAKVSGSNPSACTLGIPVRGGCQSSTGDPRLILGKGYRLVVLGGYGRNDPLLNKPFYPNGAFALGGYGRTLTRYLTSPFIPM
ncbi:unnamed protein product, partial [Closterium sp. NIES-54]